MSQIYDSVDGPVAELKNRLATLKSEHMDKIMDITDCYEKKMKDLSEMVSLCRIVTYQYELLDGLDYA